MQGSRSSGVSSLQSDLIVYSSNFPADGTPALVDAPSVKLQSVNA